MPKALPLDEDRVDVWYFPTDNCPEHDLFARYASDLSGDELARYRRFCFPRDRRKFLTTRVLLRNALSAYSDVAPASWEFEASRYGKPEVRSAPALPRLKFNVSRTASLSACIVSTVHDVGIDVEKVIGSIDVASLVSFAFFPQDAKALERLDHDERCQTFFENWTLKEAYLKARGTGLSGPLKQVSWRRSGHGVTEAQFSGEAPDDAAQWQFFLFHPGPRHVCSVAVRCEERRNLNLTEREFVQDI